MHDLSHGNWYEGVSQTKNLFRTVRSWPAHAGELCGLPQTGEPRRRSLDPLGRCSPLDLFSMSFCVGIEQNVVM
jgi:hypothetical protein